MTIADCRGWAFGLLGIRRDDFYAMPVGEFWEAMRAYGVKQEANARHIGELVRGAALRLFNVQLRRKDQIRRPEEFWRMPWDSAEAVKAPDAVVSEKSLGRLMGLLGKLK